MIASPLKYVSDFTTDIFFVRKEAFHLNISTIKETTKDKILILIISLEKDFKNVRQTFWDTNRSTKQQNLLIFFLSQETRASGII